MSEKIDVIGDEDMSCTPPELCKSSEEVVSNLLPDKSKASYEISYDNFLTWQKKSHTTSFSQRVLLAYFSTLSVKWKSSTLWSEYSKLAKMLKIKQNVDMKNYQELKSFLKKLSVGYRPNKSRTLTAKDVKRYLNEAPDHSCLGTKVAMIFGVLGEGRKDELIKVELSHLKTFYEPQDNEKMHPILLVRLPDTKTHQEREFTIKGQFYSYYQKYSVLRPEKVNHNRFFLNFQKGKCTVQPNGEKKFAPMPKEVAKFLKLPDPEPYTGHSFRRTSATLLAESGADIVTLKRHGGWKSASVAEGYVESSLFSKGKISDQITSAIHLDPSTSNQATALMENDPNPIRKEVNIPSTSKQQDIVGKENAIPSLVSDASDGRIMLNISGCSNCSSTIHNV